MANIPVFLASDNNYAPFVASTIASICDNTKSFIDIYVLDGGITNKNKEKINKLKEKFNNFSLEFINLDLEKEFKGFNVSGHISLATYSRFLIPHLKPELSKALYSDVDVILKGDIADMYNEDMHGFAIGAVWENCFESGYNLERRSRLGISKSHGYFSAGNLLIDCEQWRKKDILKKLLGIAIERAEHLAGHDQDVLNIFFENNYCKLDDKYCYITERHAWGSNPKNIIIRHFTRFKPWEINPEIDNSLNTDHHIFWHYIKMTEFYEESLARVKYNDINEMKKFNRLQDMLQQMIRKKFNG
tara:strand:+ start:1312 stop:2217 length:906 start_codon:yes stop_codon:yes gene_type:complete